MTRIISYLTKLSFVAVFVLLFGCQPISLTQDHARLLPTDIANVAQSEVLEPFNPTCVGVAGTGPRQPDGGVLVGYDHQVNSLDCLIGDGDETVNHLYEGVVKFPVFRTPIV